MSWIGRAFRAPLAFAATIAMLLLVALWIPVAHAQDGLDVKVREAEVREDGQTRVVVDVSGVDPGEVEPQFSVAEAGEPVEGDLGVGLAGEIADPDPRSVMLAVDVSASTGGAPLENTVEAATTFTESVTAGGVAVGLVAFSGQAQLLQSPTTDAGLVASALAALTAGGPTALYDGVVLSAQAMEGVPGQHGIVVFSDGADTVSEATLDEAVTEAITVGAPITTVALETEEADFSAIEQLADRTTGQVVRVGDVGDLDQAFQRVAASLNSQYILTYPSTGNTGTFPVEVTVTAGESSAVDEIPVLNTISLPQSVPPNVVAVSSPGLFSSTTIAVVAVAVAALAVALILWSVFVPVSDRQVARNLQAAVGTTSDGNAREDLSPTTAAMSRRAIELIERVPKPEGYDEAMQQRIDRAAWPLRHSEFTTLRVVAALVAFGLTWALLDTLLFAFLFAALAWLAPNVVLGVRVRARQNKFMEQLPDTLQLLAGSLKAGYGVLQAIDTVVKESREPTKSEFQRVLSEARLGLPLEQSLEDMADRIGTDDFRWVAVSISIQRRVGGNLAQLLETVAQTLRERAATRRQIKALSAEGRLSAVILTALPFALGLYMFVVNPDYLSTLISTGIGQVMVVGAIILMVIGVFWMKNLIEIDV